MDKSLFNLHDVILLLIAFESLVLAIYLGVNQPIKRLPVLLLSAFFATHAFIALHELILWGSTFRYWVLEASPNFFFVFNITYWLNGPLLLLFICSITQNNFKLSRWHALLFTPAVLFYLFIYSHFFALPVADKINMIKDYSFADLNYTVVDLLGKILRLSFVLFATRQVLNSVSKPNAKVIIPSWLPKVLVAFSVILLWELMLSALKVYHSLYKLSYYDMVEIIGLADYYMLFFLLNALIFMTVSHFFKINNPQLKAVEKMPVDMALVERLEKTMETDKPFLNQNLSFERFAEQLNIPVKDLSGTINRHYQVNFYEFINNYRILEAKKYLEDPTHNHKSITDIFYDAGFNSKSVYNTLFKKRFNKTPSQYRNSFKPH